METRALLFGALAAIITPGVVAAAEEAQRTIVVTGQRPDATNPNADPNSAYKVDRSANGKYTEPLRDTPRSIVAIPKEVIEDIGATSLREVVRTQPGVTLGTGEGNAFGDRIFIRGFEARNDVYIDGMRDPGVTSREIFAIEQIEIVKGPSSSFGGRGTTGGALSLQSKRPQAQSFVKGDVGLGTDAFRRATVDANVASGDGLALRVNGLYHNANTPGRNYATSERVGGAASVAWEIAPEWRMSADYYLLRQHGVPDFGHPFDVTTQRPFAVDRNNYYGAIGRDFIRGTADVATAQLRYSPSDALILRSQTRYGRTTNRYVLSTPRAPCQRALVPVTLACPATGPLLPVERWTVTTGTQQRNAVNSYVANITDATLRFATGGVGHTVVVGGEYASERVRALRYAFPATVEDGQGNIIAAPGTFALNLLRPNAVLGYAIPSLVDATPATMTRVETYSAYLLDTIKISRALQLLLGLRYDDYSIRLSRASGVASSGAAVTAIDIPSRARLLNGQASIVWKPGEAASLYASYSTSSNPSGEQIDGSSISYGALAPATANLEPEHNRALEVGGKVEIAHALLTAAVYQTTKLNAREQVAPGVYQTVGTLRSRGVELSISGNIFPQLALFGGYSYVDATIRQFSTMANNGRRFPNIPRHSGSLLATYALTDALTLGGQGYCQTSISGGLTVAGTSSIPGYCRVDAVGRLSLAKNAELRVNVLNLFDRTYYDAIYTSATPFSYVAPGRSATVTLSVKL